MNYLIERLKLRGQIINIPVGFSELLSDITREVLRCQPSKECMHQFIIDYLHSVVVARREARIAKYIIETTLQKVDQIISDLCICRISKQASTNMATVMEDCFRKFLEKYRCEKEKQKEVIKFQEMDLIDDIIQRCHFSADELKITRPMIEDAYEQLLQAYMGAAEVSGGVEALYEYFLDREKKRTADERASHAAIKIQAAIRGFMARIKLFRGIKTPYSEDMAEEEEEGAYEDEAYLYKSIYEEEGILEPTIDSCSIQTDVSQDPEGKASLIAKDDVSSAFSQPQSQVPEPSEMSVHSKVAPLEVQSTAPVVVESAAPAVDESAAPAVETAAPAVDEAAAPAADESAAPPPEEPDAAEESRAPSAEELVESAPAPAEEPAAPPDDKPTAPGDDAPAEPAAETPAEAAAPAESNNAAEGDAPAE